MATLKACALFGFVLIAASGSKAELIAYRFQGPIASLHDPGGLTPGAQVGDLVEGSFAYDSQMARDDGYTFPPHIQYSATVDAQGISITVEDTTFSTGPLGTLAALVELDRFRLSSIDIRERSETDERIGVVFEFDDIVLTGSLPTSLDLTHGPSIAYVRLFESADYRVDVALASLVRVPEPSTVVLSFAALPLTYLAYRRRR